MYIFRKISLKKTSSIVVVIFFVFIQSSCSKLPAAAQSKSSSSITDKGVETTMIDPKEEKLNTLLARPAMVFTDARGEASSLAISILHNKDEFLKDLERVLSDDSDDLLTLVDKKNYLSETYIPLDIIPLKANNDYKLNRNDLSLRVPVEAALRKMSAAAKNDGVSILVSSTYRSYEYQKKLYERNVREMGKEAADRESAQPGTSQHQTGAAIDFGSITDDFALTAAGKWLDKRAGDFGFSLSFPDEYESVTGYRWECWHYRYVGVEAVNFQKKWFNNIQQYMLEFIHSWKNSDHSY